MNSIGISAAILGLKKYCAIGRPGQLFAGGTEHPTHKQLYDTASSQRLVAANGYEFFRDSHKKPTGVCSDPFIVDREYGCFVCCKENTRKKEQKHEVDGIFCRSRLEG